MFVGSLWKTRFVVWLLLPSVERLGGILVMCDSRVMKVIDNLIGEFLVSIEVLKEDDNKWWFKAIYGPCNPRQRGISGMTWLV